MLSRLPVAHVSQRLRCELLCKKGNSKEVFMFFELLHDLQDETCLFSYFLLVFCGTRLPVHFYSPPICLLSYFIPPSKCNLSKPPSALPRL